MTPNELPPEFMQIFVVNISAAILCGGTIGLERQVRGKSIGMKVCILVVITSALFVSIAREIDPRGEEYARVLSSIITGVGFLGAGVIFRGGTQVSGITTAALIWGLAAVGCTIGFGHPEIAIIATIVIMGALAFVDLLEWVFPRLKQNTRQRRNNDDFSSI